MDGLSLLLHLSDMVVGGVLGWLLSRRPEAPSPPPVITPSLPFYLTTRLPVLSEGQTGCVVFNSLDGSSRAAACPAGDILEVMTRPKGGPPQEWYRFDHIDERGRFIYQQEQ